MGRLGRAPLGPCGKGIWRQPWRDRCRSRSWCFRWSGGDARSSNRDVVTRADFAGSGTVSHASGITAPVVILKGVTAPVVIFKKDPE